MNPLLDIIPLQWPAAILLLSLRLGAMLVATPVLSSAGLPAQVRVLLVLALAMALCLGMDLAQPGAGARHADLLALLGHPGALVRAAMTELALGATMGLALHAGFAAFSTAGGMLDVQLGLGLSQLFDPASGAISTVLTSAMNRVAVLMFFLVGGHHALLRAVAFSLDRVPLGAGWDAEAAMGAMAGHVAALFALSVALVAPVVVCLLLSELALGALARNLPQVNMLTLGLPLKIAIGLAALGLWFTSMGTAMDRVYRGIFEAIGAALAVAGPAPAGG